jgi:hypothetical protein
LKTLICSSLGADKLYCLPFFLTTLRALGGDAVSIVCDGFPVPEELQAALQENETAVSLPEVEGADWALDAGARTGRVREYQRQEALMGDYTYAYLHDCDMLPPADILAHLAAHDLPATSGLYNMRGRSVVAIPAAGTPCTEQPGPMTGLVDLQPCSGGYLAAHVGMGCLLLRRDALEVPFRTPEALHQTGLSEDVAWGADYWATGGRIFVDPTLPCWHVDNDLTANRLRVGEEARGAIWTDTPHFVRNAFGLWERGIPLFGLSEEAMAQLSPGFVVGDYPRLTVEVKRLEEINDNGSVR